MGVAPAIIGGVSAVAGVASQSKARSDARKQAEQQEKLIEKQQALQQASIENERQMMLFQFDRENAVSRAQTDLQLFNNEMSKMMQDTQVSEQQIQLQAKQTQDQQQELSRIAAANQQATSVFGQLRQRQEEVEQQTGQLQQEFAQRQAAQGSLPNQGESISNLLDEERQSDILEAIETDNAELALGLTTDALSQLGYEVDAANLEAAMTEIATGYVGRQLTRQGELNQSVFDANQQNIGLQDQRNQAAREFGLRSGQASLATAQSGSDIAFASQKQAVEAQRAANSPSIFPSVVGLAQSGFNIYNTVRQNNLNNQPAVARPPAAQAGGQFYGQNLGRESSIFPNVAEYNTQSFDPYGNYLTGNAAGNTVTGSSFGDLVTEAPSSSSIAYSGSVSNPQFGTASSFPVFSRR